MTRLAKPTNERRGVLKSPLATARALVDRRGNRKVIDVAAAAGSRGVRQVVLLLAMAMAARILGTELLAVWALVHIVIQFGTLLGEAGISTFVIREKDLTDRIYATAFYLCVALSFVVTLVTAAAIIPIVELMGFTEYSTYFLVASIAIIPTSIGAVLRATLQRDRKFTSILMVELIANALLMVGIATFLLSGAGLWSLVLPAIISSVTACVAYTWYLPIPQPHMDRESVRRIVNYASGLVGFSSVNFWGRNADHVLIGRFLGAAPLGIYSVAYRIMTLPATQINAIAMTVALPYLAPHQDNQAKLRSSMRRLLTLLGMIGTAPMILVWLQSYQVVEIVLGNGWERVGDLLLILVPLGVYQMLDSPVGLCYQISGRTRMYFAIGLSRTLTSLVSFVIGVWIGSIDAVVWSYTVATILFGPIAISCGLWTIGARFRDWLRWCSPFLLCFPLCWLARQTYAGAVGQWGLLAADLCVVTLICGIVSWFAFKVAWPNVTSGRREKQLTPAEMSDGAALNT